MRRERLAGREVDLERPDDPLLVARHDARARRRIHAREQAMQTFGAPAGGEAVEPIPQRLVGAGTGKQAPHERPVVEPGAADQNREPPAPVHVADGGGRIARVLRGGIDLGGVGNVDEVVRDALPVAGGHLVGADVEAAVDRGRVAVEDLAVELAGQRQSERALPRRGRPQHRQDPRPTHRPLMRRARRRTGPAPPASGAGRAVGCGSACRADAVRREPR